MDFKTLTISLKSASPYSQSKMTAPKPNGKSWEDYENENWKQRIHTNADGHVFIPAAAFKQALDNAAYYLKMKKKGNVTWSKHIKSGLMIPDNLALAATEKDVVPEWISAHADGKRGSGTRVPRCYPTILEWSGDLNIVVLDSEITREVFEEHMRASGLFIGVGRWRAENGGQYGRFTVEKIQGWD